MPTIQNFEIAFLHEKLPHLQLSEILCTIPFLSFSFRFSLFAVELAIRAQFLVMRKVWPQSSFQKERVGQK